MKKRTTLSLAIMLFGFINLTYGQIKSALDNETQVKESILDYVEGVYEADTTKSTSACTLH